MTTSNYPEFQGKNVFITGSTQNLGFSIAKLFAGNGANVIVHGRQPEGTDEAKKKILAEYPKAKVHALPFDLGDQKAIETAFAQLEKLNLMPDILVNNGAHLGLGESGFLEQTPDFFREVLEVNIMGYFRSCHIAAKHMKKIGGGNIINISSLAGERSIWGRTAYNVSKSAIDSLTRSMALELAEYGIRVNSVSPGYIWTPRWDKISTEQEKRRKLNIPCGKSTQQEEIAEIVLFLASDKAPTMIGSRIIIDGGLAAQQVPRDTSI